MPSINTFAMPDQGSLKPIQRTPVPEKLNVTEFTSVRAALPPLWFGAVLVAQSPVYWTAALFCSTRVQVVPPPSPLGFTFRVTVNERLKPPLEPVMVNVKAPVCAVLVAVTASVEEPE